MSRLSGRRRALFLLPILAAALAGCAARTPLALTGVTGSTGEVLMGSMPATVYTGLRETPGDGKACRSSYTGNPSSNVVLLEVDCPDGGRGIGTGVVEAGKLVGGSVRMRDGQEAMVRVEAEPASR